MSWAGNRQAFFITTLGAVLVAIISVVIIAFIYEVPSCNDRKQNQDETGIDCGGSCLQLCTTDVSMPVVVFARALQIGEGKADFIAYIENRNNNAEAEDAPYLIEFFDEHTNRIAFREGTITLSKTSRTPLFIPNIYAGGDRIAQTFITFDSEKIIFKRAQDQIEEPLRILEREYKEGETPRVTANIFNPREETLRNVRVVAVLFNSSDEVIGASQTIINSLAPSQASSVFFTWNNSFEEVPSRIDIVPLP